MNYSVVIVENHILLSQALAKLIDEFPEFKTSNCYKNGKTLLNHLQQSDDTPDIILIDINRTFVPSIQTITTLKKEYPKIPILALSSEESDESILTLLQAGANGYLSKNAKKKSLKNALVKLQKTGFYYTKYITNLLLKSLHYKEKNNIILKDREIAFVKYACTEKTYKEIAYDMCLSPKTIEGYRDAIFGKLNLKNRTGMVLYAIKNNIFVP